MATNKTIKRVPEKTPEGLAMWAKVNTVVDEFKGGRKYNIKLELPEKDEKEFIAKIEKTYKDFQALPENKGKLWRPDDRKRLSFKPDKKSGKIQFTFSTNAFYKDKDNKEQKKVISVRNRYGQHIEDQAIGNGSLVKIGYLMKPYWENEDQNGIKLYLNEIIVKKLVEFGNSSLFDDEFEEFDGETPTTGNDDFPDDDDDFPDKINI
jgi:hypothetical protein